MSQKRSSRRVGGPLAAAVLSVTVLVALVPPRAATAAQQPAEGHGGQLQQEIQDLLANAWDQRMARRMEMGLEIPYIEAAARFDILQRWAQSLGAHGVELAEDFAKREKAAKAILAKAKSDDSVDLDPVLLFIEEGSEILREAAGIESRFP